MSAFAWALALAATLASGAVGLACAAIVAGLTRAPHLRYAACTAALAFAVAPLLMGFAFAGGHQAAALMPRDPGARRRGLPGDAGRVAQ